MPNDTRPYITVHNGMPEHPKIEDLSDASFRALVTLWCWCSRNETDGWITPAVWAKRTTAPVRRELLVALVEDHGDRYYMHDYLDHQRSAQEIADLRDKRSRAGSKGGKKAALARASAQASATANGQQTGSKLQAETDSIETSLVGKPPRQEVADLCNQLADRIEANGAKRPRVTQKWLDECRRLIDRDGIDPTKAARLIDWCQADPFWRANILSMPKFREQYDQLRLKALAEWEQHRGGVSPDGVVNVDAILGAEKFQLPTPPDDLTPGSPEWQAWQREQRDAWVAAREAKAREVLARRAS